MVKLGNKPQWMEFESRLKEMHSQCCQVWPVQVCLLGGRYTFSRAFLKENKQNWKSHSDVISIFGNVYLFGISQHWNGQVVAVTASWSLEVLKSDKSVIVTALSLAMVAIARHCVKSWESIWTWHGHQIKVTCLVTVTKVFILNTVFLNLSGTSACDHYASSWAYPECSAALNRSGGSLGSELKCSDKDDKCRDLSVGAIFCVIGREELRETQARILRYWLLLGVVAFIRSGFWG